MLTKTTSAFPTLFFDWDNQYGVSGEYVLTHPDGKFECVSLGTSSMAVPIVGNPQPSPPRNTDPAFNPGPDVLGWGYMIEPNGAFGPSTLVSLLDLLPEEPRLPHSVIRSCTESEVFPAHPGFDALWLAVGADSTVYEGDEEGTSVTTAGTGTGGVVSTTASGGIPRETGKSSVASTACVSVSALLLWDWIVAAVALF